MVHFRYSSAGTYYHSIVSLMVFQVIIVLSIGQVHIALLSKQHLLDAIFIDHIATVILRGGSTIDGMHRAEFRPVRCIAVGDGTAVTESYLAWQI